MSDHSVHWHEGMFLLPQHFQLAERRQAETWRRSAQWNVPYHWGLHSIDIDLDALANYRFVVRSLQARFHNGEQVVVPDDVTLPVLDLQERLKDAPAVRLFLAQPLWRQTQPNVADDPQHLAARHLVETREIEDENTGAEARTLLIRKPNLRLLTSLDDQSGYDLLPIAQVRLAERSDAAPELDPSFIPPLLSCSAWSPLHQGILQRLHDRVGRKAELLAVQAVARGIGHDSCGEGDRALLEQLQVLNEADAVLGVDATSQGVHPWIVYREFARLVGALATFAPERKTPSLRPYRHDDLAGCFGELRRVIDRLLDQVVEPQYFQRPFRVDGACLRVAIDGSWLEPRQQILLGIESPLPVDHIEQLLSSGQDVKIGSGARAEELFLRGQAGLKLRPLARPPRPLPVRRGLTYFEIERDANPEQWRQVERTLSLAARFNERVVVGELAEQNALVLDVRGKSTTLQMYLFAAANPNATSLGAPLVAEAGVGASVATSIAGH